METKTLNLKPLGDRVIVQPFPEEEVTRGGVIIPDTAKEKPMQGKVMAVGSGRRLDNGQIVPLEIKEGDTVLYGKYSGTEVKVEGEKYLIVKESEILAIVK